MSRSIVFIHGAWLTPASWNLFKGRYERRGYTCLAPPWPYDGRAVAELRRAPVPDLAQLGIAEIVSHYADVIRACAEPPILIGHSFGGLLVQLLLDRGLGAVGVAIDPAPIKGVLPGPSALRAALPVLLTWKGWTRVARMSFAAFQRDFAHTLSEAGQREAYDRYIVPTPGRVYFENGLGIESAVDFENPARAPLLLIAGLNDRTIEPGMVRATYRKQRRSPAVTALKEFPGRTHFLIASPGWEEVADFCLEWGEHHLMPVDRALHTDDRSFA
jgi:pimeloyl-ACP methyl ester carboxylesterase